MRIIFFGADRWFSEPVPAVLVKARHEILMVVTKGEMRNEFNKLIKLNKLKTLAVEVKNQIDISRQRLVSLLRSDLPRSDLGRSDLLAPEAIVVASFGPPFLPDEILNWPKYGCLNVHASLLPRWRGASPVFAAIAAGDKETGVSIMRMTEEIDRGPVLGQAGLEIHQPGIIRPGPPEADQAFSNYDNRETLTKRLGKLGGELIVETLKKLETGQITEVRQPIKSPTPYTRRLTKQSGRIDWSQSPIEIERFIRAVTPWPGAETNFRFKISDLKFKTGKLKILKAHLEKIQNSLPAIGYRRRRLQAGEFRIQNCLAIDEVQLPGKNPVSWKQFLAGHPNITLVHGPKKSRSRQ